MIITKVVFNALLYSYMGVAGYSIASIIAITASILLLMFQNRSLFSLEVSANKVKMIIIFKTILSFIIIYLLNTFGVLISDNLVGILVSSSFIVIIYYFIFKKEIKLNAK